ncbi:MAG: hypothetical protein PWR01_3914 [Clostridiales bacterium]|nr:hypothetical protein [Clostridiales bacterium]MDN5282841.1 hypothetical protein [Candidatus Ozemobacter sp.]
MSLSKCRFDLGIKPIAFVFSIYFGGDKTKWLNPASFFNWLNSAGLKSSYEFSPKTHPQKERTRQFARTPKGKKRGGYVINIILNWNIYLQLFLSFRTMPLDSHSQNQSSAQNLFPDSEQILFQDIPNQSF